MPTVSYDAQSFTVDGRRLWLVAGAIHYPRTPRELWADRLRAAKQAGLNCIETYVFWNWHEPEPGVFDFTGDRDLRAFVELVGEMGMWCILRPGPFVCSEWDMGGLPPWLRRDTAVLKAGRLRVRQNEPAYLAACSRYLGAVMEQVKDLQVTHNPPGKTTKPARLNLGQDTAGGYQGQGGGPILLMQAENEWFCHNPEQHDPYLYLMVRYLRENGCEVPILNCNMLWQRIEGTIDAWNASNHLPEMMRQLATVQPEAPRLVTEYWTGWFDAFGEKHANSVDARKHLHRLAGAMAVGAQTNQYMFHGGTNFGFTGGRTVNNRFCFMTTSYDYDAPLLEAGGRGTKYLASKRAGVFQSQFAAQLASLEPGPGHVAPVLDEEDGPVSVVHQAGSLGDLIVILRGRRDKTKSVDVMLPTGESMPVPLGDEPAVWLLLEANLAGVVTLDYTNLSPWAFLGGKLLVLFGPTGASGLFAINGTPVEVKVPGGKTPLVEQHEGVTVAVLNPEQIDAAYVGDDGLIVGCAGLDEQGEPMAAAGWTQRISVSIDGEVARTKQTAKRKPSAPKLSGWSRAGCEAWLNGEAQAFEAIDQPQGMARLGVDSGYGWYRLPMDPAIKATDQLTAPLGGDRLHVFQDQSRLGILGLGPGANLMSKLGSIKGEVTVLADNMGRYNYGQHVGQDRKGLPHGLQTAKPVKLAKPKVDTAPVPPVFDFDGYLTHWRRDELSECTRLIWKVKPASRKPMLLTVDDLPGNAAVTVNGEVVGVVSSGHSAHYVDLVLEPGVGPMTGGQNEIALCLIHPQGDPAALAKHVTLTQLSGPVHPKRKVSRFAAWTPPGEDEYTPLPTKPKAKGDGLPAWFAGTFSVGQTRVPLWIEPVGMSKGQIYLNGHNVGRFWMNDPSGKPVPPQSLYYLPEPWIHTDRPNRLVLFDEHGCLPSAARLVYNAMGPYHR